MPPHFENPFADDSGIASGSRFIGRSSSLQVLEDRVLSPQKPGNLALVGLPCIGKSSLAHHALIERKHDAINRVPTSKFLPIWLDLATYQQPAALFHSLVEQCAHELRQLQWLTDPMHRAANHALHEEDASGEGFGRLLRFFEKVRQAGVRVIVVLDAFDHIGQLFKEDASGLLRLGELSDRTASRVTLVTLSRRSIHEIEQQIQTTSVLDRLFNEHYVTMFDELDWQMYCARFAAVGLPVTSMLKESIDFYTGGHPYLMQLLGHKLVETFHGGQGDDVDAAAHEVEQAFVSYYHQLLEFLREHGMLDQLLHVLFSPDAKELKGARQAPLKVPTDEAELSRYGLIKASQQNGYAAFSAHFQSFLRLMEAEIHVWPGWQEMEETQPLEGLETDLWPIWDPVEDNQPSGSLRTDLWPLWRETERTLRAALMSALQVIYGEDWFASVEQSYPALGYKAGMNVFQRCREAQQKEEIAWGSRAPTPPNLLEFTAPQELFALVFAEWGTFKSVFGQEQTYWRLRSQLLVRVRMLLAHNRAETAYSFELRLFEEYCQEILRLLGKAGTPPPTGETDLWSLWRETDRMLRTVLALALQRVYGSGWFARIEQAYPLLGYRDGKNVFQRHRELRQKEEQFLGTRPLPNPLDLIYPQELFVLVFTEWRTFEPVFGKDWVYWEQRAQLFAMMRNPLAHNRDEAIFGEKRRAAENCCREIQAPLRAYLDQPLGSQ